MTVDREKLNLLRAYQDLAAHGFAPLPQCSRDDSIRLLEVGDDDEIYYRCTYCRGKYYPGAADLARMRVAVEEHGKRNG